MPAFALNHMTVAAMSFQPMLDLALADLEREPEIASRARLICDKLPSPRLETGAYDLLLSNSLLHHLHDPQVLWRSLPVLGRPGAIVLIMDLMRPASARSSPCRTALIVAISTSTAVSTR